jgi:hypothetical protein
LERLGMPPRNPPQIRSTASIRKRRLRTAAVCWLAALATLGMAGTGAAANSGGGFFSFLEGLFGVPPPSEPRRQRWREKPSAPPAMRSQPPPAPASPTPAPVVTTYRTMCVRLCDGYYWPVSFATPMDALQRDEQACRKSCGATSALYYYPNPGGQVEEMVSAAGKPYKDLSTAFLYRTVYDPACKCRPHPWEEGAIERHKSYAASQSPPRALAQGARPRR